MKVVFVGAGAVFGYHSQQFCQAAPQGSEFFVVEPDDATARLSGMQRISLSEAAMIADIAIVMTPSYVRMEVCEPFIEVGIPLVIEKPLTIHWDEIVEFADAAQQTWICPIVNIRVLKKVENIVTSAKNPTLIRSWKIRHRPADYYDDWHGKYATDGGVLAQQGFHCLDLVCWVGSTYIGGEVKEVSAVGSNRSHDIECEDTALVDIRFASGMEGRVECTTGADSSTTNDAGLEVVTPMGNFGTHGGMFASGTPGHTILAQRVFHALAENQPPPITVQSMVPSLYALHACYASMANGGEWTKIGVRSRLGR